MVNPTARTMDTTVLSPLMNGVYLLWLRPNDWNPDWNA